MQTLVYHFRWLLRLLCLPVLLIGCSNAVDAPAPAISTDARPPLVITPTTAATPTPRPPGGNLTIGVAEDVPVLRPWQPDNRTAELISAMMYPGLIRLDQQLRPQPDLALSWTPSSDGRALTVTLRSGLTWHDGDPLTANDVRFTFERLRSLPYTSTALLADLRYISAVTVASENTIVLSLTERFAPLLAYLAVPILPEHLLQDRDLNTFNFWDVPIGSGPFQLERRVPGQSVILSRYPRYYRGAPLLTRVAFVVSPDPNTTLGAVRDGTLLLAELPWQTGSPLLSDPAYQSGEYAENGFYFLGFNLREGRPFADLRVRRALALALDVPRLVEASTDGQGIIPGSSALPNSWADLTSPRAEPPDLVTARGLLAEAGWELPTGATIRQRNGVPFTARLYVRSDDPRRVALAERIAEAASAVGLQIIVEPADFATSLVARYAPPYDFDLLLGSWLNGAGSPEYGDFRYYDPDDFDLFHSSQINQSELDTRVTRNVVGFQDETYDELAERGRQVYDLNERIAAYRASQQRITEELPYLYLWTDRTVVVLNNRVTSLDGPINLSTPMYYYNIETWSVANAGS